MGVHDEHRRRLKERYLKEGPDHFSAHEILELLLFYAIPQKDTNVLAHELIERFGSLHGVFEARYADLQSVRGVGEHTALLLHMIPGLLRRYALSQTKAPMLVSKDTDTVAEMLRPHFLGRTKEVMFLLCIDDGGGILYSDVVFEGTVNAVYVHVREILKIVLECGATGVILAHNHPRGLAVPSSDDVALTDKVSRALGDVQIVLLDHFIFTADDFISMRRSGYFSKKSFV